VKHVVQVVGLSGLGKPFKEEVVHHPEVYTKISSLKIGELITVDAIIRALTNQQGGLKNIPNQTRRTVLLNQADTDELQASANGMVQSLLSGFDAVVIANLSEEKIHAVYERLQGSSWLPVNPRDMERSSSYWIGTACLLYAQ
jgi:probable selenium-dependent hydroxylase accessory protein YqeC